MVINPPVNGDANGPTKTAMAKIAIAIPRYWLLYRSAKIAGTTDSGLAAKKPAKNRVNMIVCTSFAVAVPMVNTLYPNRPINMGHRRPESSEVGAQSVGPDANPKTYSVTPNVETSELMPNWLLIEPTADEKIALEKEAVKVEKLRMAAITVLSQRPSAMPSQLYRLPCHALDSLSPCWPVMRMHRIILASEFHNIHLRVR